MARKKKPPEPENLERWLVSYGDFITLLFATFVVLYALAQVDVAEFDKLEESLRQAFANGNIMQGQESIMDNGQSIFDKTNGDSLIAPIMMEYLNPKYEEQSFKDIEKSIEQMKKDGELDGIDAKVTDKGLLITFNEECLFKSASAALTEQAKKTIDKVGVLICEKFIMHYIRVEGHTDNQPMVSYVYPSNWELSSSRACSIVKYFIDRFLVTPELLTAVGYADTRPVADNNTPEGRKQNRRVEVLILKNRYKNFEHAKDSILKMSKEEQLKLQEQRMETLKKIRGGVSEAAQKLMKENNTSENEVIKLKQQNTLKPDKIESISQEAKDLYYNIDKTNENTPARSADIKMEVAIPTDEDLGI